MPGKYPVKMDFYIVIHLKALKYFWFKDGVSVPLSI